MRFFPLCRVLLLATFLSLRLTLPAAAQLLYVAGDNAQFGVLNAATGAYNRIATTQLGGVNTTLSGLGYGSNGQLYGLEFFNGTGVANRLFTVNATTGALTTVGTISAFANTVGTNTIGMTSYNGTLYAIYAEFGQAAASLYTISSSSAQASLIGSIGATGLVGNGNIAANAAGDLLVNGGDTNDEIRRVNRTSGVGTRLSASSGLGTSFALGYTGTTLYGLNTSGGIYTINQTTGAATFQANYNASSGGAGQAYAAIAAPASVLPEPGTLAFVGMGALPLVGVAARRKKRKAA